MDNVCDWVILVGLASIFDGQFDFKNFNLFIKLLKAVS